MKYHIHVNQQKAIELGIKNIQEAHIFDLLISASTWATPEIIENDVYYWVARQKISEMLPLLNLKTDTIYRYLKHLKEIGLIEYIKKSKKDLIKITSKGKKYLVKEDKNTMSEKNPSYDKNSEKNPKKLGKFSENTMSEKNPTYTIILDTTIKDNNKTLSEIINSFLKKLSTKTDINLLRQRSKYEKVIFSLSKYYSLKEIEEVLNYALEEEKYLSTISNPSFLNNSFENIKLAKDKEKRESSKEMLCL